jgi:hypothetical protein
LLLRIGGGGEPDPRLKDKLTKRASKEGITFAVASWNASSKGSSKRTRQDFVDTVCMAVTILAGELGIVVNC